MSEDDDGAEVGGPSGGRKKRRRVTLNWSRPLVLPEDPEPQPEPESMELRLPDDLHLATSERLSTQPPIAEVDGWSRDRALRTPLPTPPNGPISSAPPPPPQVPPEYLERGSVAPSGDGALPQLGGALDLVDRRGRKSETQVDLAAEMSDKFALGDFTGALRVADLILGKDPDHELAKTVGESARERLATLFTSRLGGMQRVMQVKVRPEDVRWLGLDHRAGFLLSRVDGVATVEEIVQVSGMPRLETLKTLVELIDMGAIGPA